MLLSACAENTGDGVQFDVGAAQTEVIWAETPFPGVRAQIPAAIGEERGMVQVDLGFGDPLVPPAAWLDYPTLAGPPPRLLAARPETMLGWKVHGLFERGYGQWRPKDLHDVLLLTRWGGLAQEWLAPAVAVAFRSRDTPLSLADRFLQGPWGRSRGSQARWSRFRRAGSAEHIPEQLSEVVAEVTAALRPVFARI